MSLPIHRMMTLRTLHSRLAFVAVIVTGASIAPASAQLVRPNVRMVDARAGLSHDQVNALARDQRGHMWFGTSDGLSRFDGTRVKVYSRNSRLCPLPSDHINALATDSAGSLYIGSQSQWLTVLDPLIDTLVNIRLPVSGDPDIASVEISAILVDTRERIWIGHGHRNLSLFDERSRTFRSVVIQTPNSHSQGRNWIRKIVEGRDGYLWLCCEFGLVRFDPRDFSHVLFPTNARSPTAYQHPIASVWDEGTTLLVGTFSGGLLRFNKNTGTFTQLAFDSARTVMDMVDMGNDRLWLAAGEQGVLEFDPRTDVIASFDRILTHARSRERSDFLPGAQCFLRDAEGTTWIGTGQTGVALMAKRNNRFDLFGLPMSGTNTTATEVGRIAVHPTTNEWLVLAPFDGLYVLGSEGSVAGHYPVPVTAGGSAALLDLLVGSDGAVHVSSDRGLFILHSGSNRFVRDPLVLAGSPFTHVVRSLWGDGGNGIWGDVDGLGLMHLDTVTGATTSVEDLAPGISEHLQYPLRDLVVDVQGRMWIGMTRKPPVVLRPDGHYIVWKIGEDDPDALPTAFMTTLCEATDGTVWGGTWIDGLVGMRMDAEGNTRHTRITTAHGLPSNTIYGLVLAHDGALWGTGKSGLFRFDPASNEVQRFGMNDGLPTPEIYMSFDISPDRRRVFGGVFDGVVTFHLDSLRASALAPEPLVQIPLVTVFDSTVAMNADMGGAVPITLPHDRSDLRFVLRSTNMVDPFNDSYAYRLVGADTVSSTSDWTITPAQDAILFSQIQPGAHVFEVKARTGTAAWGAISRVSFTVLPPWWSTWWFRVMVLALIGALIYSGFRAYLYVRLRRQRSAYERKQAVMQERIRIASDMHDDLGSGLSVIKVKSQIALLTETDPQRVTELEEIARGSGELIDNMRQIVWTLGSGQESLADLVAYMRNYAGKYLEPYGIACSFHADDQLPTIGLSAIERRNLLLVTKEALHNVVKHANATAVRISITWDRGLHLAISDNGRGMDPDRPTTYGMGMNTMRQRITQLGGVLDAKNHEGTTLHFHVPTLGSAERSIAGS